MSTDVNVIGRPTRQLTWQLVVAMTACVLGCSFQFGYHTGVVNAPQEAIEGFLKTTYYENYKKDMPESTKTFLWSVVVAIYAIGGMIGGFSTGWFTDRYGRKMTMLCNNALVMAGAGLMFGSKFFGSYQTLIVGRFVIGICCGISTAVAPVYLSEIAPVNLRGAAGTLNQLAITVGVLVSQICGLNSMLGNSWGWNYLLGLTIVPAICQVLILPMCPESPRYLYITKNSHAQAREALVWLRGTTDVKEDIKEMEMEKTAAQSVSKAKIIDLLRSPSLRVPLMISVVMQLSQQWSGINAVIFYSTKMFVNARLTDEQAQYATLGTGVVNVVMTLISAFLVDRLGRRFLHLSGLGGMFLFSITLTLSLLWKDMWENMPAISVLSVSLYIVAFALGPGAIPWFIVAELFAQGPRQAAMSVAVLVNWLANFCVGIGFPALQESLGEYSFVPFTVLLALFWVFTYHNVPETKNKKIEEITALFEKPMTGPKTAYQALPTEA